MGFSVADQYYLKAQDNYPFELEKAIEQLLYALSSDPDHCQSNWLLGQLYMYQMNQFDKAEYYFNQAIQANMTYTDAFRHLCLLKTWTGEYEQVLKIIDYTLQFQDMNQWVFYVYKAIAFEHTGRISQSLQVMDQALNCCLIPTDIAIIKQQINRIKAKIKRYKKRKKKALAKVKKAESKLKTVV